MSWLPGVAPVLVTSRVDASVELVTVAELRARRDELLARAGMSGERLAELAADYRLSPELQRVAGEVDGIDWLLHG